MLTPKVLLLTVVALASVAISGCVESAELDPPATQETPAPTVSPEQVPAATPQELPKLEVPVVPRTRWSTVPPGTDFVFHDIVAITVHHTASVLREPGGGAEKARSHQRYHLSRGWPDIAYHFVIDGAGNVLEGRPVTARGDTATSYDPTGYLLITLEGNFEEQEPTEVQFETLVSVLAWGSEEFGVPPEQISGHRDHAATLCPGQAVHERIQSGELARRVQQRLDEGGAMLSSDSDAVAAKAPARPCRVAVDVGHTRERPGATSASGRPEWEFNRRLAGELVTTLPDAFLVDPGEVGLPLLERPTVARDRSADLFLSIHHDSVQPHYLESHTVDGVERQSTRRFRGHSLFISSRGLEPESSERLGRSVGAAFVAAGFTPTKHHAEPIEGEGRPWVEESIGLHRYDGLAVLRGSDIPALLIEADVIVNPDAEHDLDRADYRARLVTAIGAGVHSFCEERE